MTERHPDVTVLLGVNSDRPDLLPDGLDQANGRVVVVHHGMQPVTEFPQQVDCGLQGESPSRNSVFSGFRRYLLIWFDTVSTCR